MGFTAVLVGTARKGNSMSPTPIPGLVVSEEPQVGLRLSKVDLRRQLLRYAFARIPRNVSLCFQATVDGFPSHFRPVSYSVKQGSCLGCRWESRGPAVASVVVNHPGSSSIHPLLSICLWGGDGSWVSEGKAASGRRWHPWVLIILVCLLWEPRALPLWDPLPGHDGGE